MNHISAAAMLTALALLVFPASPRRRLAACTSARRLVVGARGVVCLAACAAVAAAVVLPPTTVLAAAIVAATASVRYRRRRRLRRAIEEGQTLEAALDVLVGELRVGSHPVRAFGVAADETLGAVSMSLRGVAARARLGADVTAGLRAVAGCSAQPIHWHRLAVCWQLASDHGLAIATLMRTAQRDIVEHQRFSSRVDSGMAGARATAAILAGLPLLGVLLGQLIGARPLSFLLSGHAVGGCWWSGRCWHAAGCCGRTESSIEPGHEYRGGTAGRGVVDRAAPVCGANTGRHNTSRASARPGWAGESGQGSDPLAVCLQAGMAVSTATAAIAGSAPPKLARVLRRAADLLALGADPAVAWSISRDKSVDVQTDALLRLARRSASSGAALADGVAELADQARHDAAHAAAAAAERAGVLIAGPLGLCFLPAFVCLGIVPLVAGLAGDVLQSGLL
ncbi:hypothetical protein MSTO_43740 [Mycobacterium stomatepiae]|uniref:Type II secretion system protein GspF domain-containing protein n=1 Tax=Mycobacterium stomatepiae TaxID=470076 RepID=A0A7I7QD23_9MYCO|nr:hypothetical protein MSTO_43740 [Mycobacterium stomatepiae]